MAGYLNKVCLIGNVGIDPEITNLQSGGIVANFTLATSESWKDKKTGEKKEKTEWHRIVVWSEGLCGVIEQYVRKGQRLYVEGELQTRKWEKDGVERYTTEVVLTGFDAKLIMLDRGGGGGDRDPNDNASRPGNKAGSGYADQSGGTARNNSGSGRQDQRGNMQRDIDDEIPF